MEVGLLENLQREDMGIVDTVRTYKRIRSEFKRLSVEELGEMLGVKPDAIASKRWVLDLPEVTQQALNEGVLSLDQADRIQALDETRQRELIKYILEENPDQYEILERIKELREQPEKTTTNSDTIQNQTPSEDGATSASTSPSGSRRSS